MGLVSLIIRQFSYFFSLYAPVLIYKNIFSGCFAPINLIFLFISAPSHEEMISPTVDHYQLCLGVFLTPIFKKVFSFLHYLTFLIIFLSTNNQNPTLIPTNSHPNPTIPASTVKSSSILDPRTPDLPKHILPTSKFHTSTLQNPNSQSKNPNPIIQIPKNFS